MPRHLAGRVEEAREREEASDRARDERGTTLKTGEEDAHAHGGHGAALDVAEVWLGVEEEGVEGLEVDGGHGGGRDGERPVGEGVVGSEGGVGGVEAVGEVGGVLLGDGGGGREDVVGGDGAVAEGEDAAADAEVVVDDDAAPVGREAGVDDEVDGGEAGGPDAEAEAHGGAVGEARRGGAAVGPGRLDRVDRDADADVDAALLEEGGVVRDEGVVEDAEDLRPGLDQGQPDARRQLGVPARDVLRDEIRELGRELAARGAGADDDEAQEGVALRLGEGRVRGPLEALEHPVPDLPGVVEVLQEAQVRPLVVDPRRPERVRLAPRRDHQVVVRHLEPLPAEQVVARHPPPRLVDAHRLGLVVLPETRDRPHRLLDRPELQRPHRRARQQRGEQEVVRPTPPSLTAPHSAPRTATRSGRRTSTCPASEPTCSRPTHSRAQSRARDPSDPSCLPSFLHQVPPLSSKQASRRSTTLELSPRSAASWLPPSRIPSPVEVAAARTSLSRKNPPLPRSSSSSSPPDDLRLRPVTLRILAAISSPPPRVS
mmetsp:Transcript_3654/g.11242  ORF Transcript_3654/g.11242 Transcript_3654/m.11242 type:complete len:543 (+) Transcript_3654:1285-2913(+)